MAPSTSTALVFTNSASDTQFILFKGLPPGAEWIVLDAEQDGIEQITAVLANRSGIQSLHIVLPAGLSNLKLGSADLTLFNLDRYGWQLQQWGEALGPNGNISLYGCHDQTGSRGAVVHLSSPLLTRLRLLTGANIAAFTDFSTIPTLTHPPVTKSFRRFAVIVPSR